MPLPAGERLGPYEIVAPIGAGGMGEVYRARDSRLGRDVAIKVSAERFSERFEREARTVASLNHPNICALYDVGPNYLVMELVEGEAPHGPLPLDTALQYARQIADALDAAHEKGIVHRDLKPNNIKITPEGVVKVLDFGLAKVGGAPGAGSSEDSPTLSMAATQMGVILGTAGYMAPEQARGKPVDKRADIWAFGVVLYEMITGRRLFDGETVSDTLAAVLQSEPPLERLPAQVRPTLERCLRKDRRRRWRDIGDVKMALEEGQADTPPFGSASRRSIAPWAAAVGMLAVTLAVVSWVAWRGTRPVARPLMRLNVSLGPQAVAGNRITAAISPDGARLAFPMLGPDGKQQLGTRLLDQPQAVLLSGTENAADPFFSPDGQWIGFFADGKLRKVSVQGGAVVALCDAPNGRGASWGDDGNIILTSDSIDGYGLSRVPGGGGVAQPLTKTAEHGDASHRWPQILPGGRSVLFTSSKTNGDFENASLEVVSIETGQIKVLLTGGYFGRYLPSGHLVYLNRGTLFGVSFDLDRLATRGSPVPLLQDVAGNPISGGGQFDSARDGTFVYLSGKSASQTIQWLDHSGAMQPLRATQGAAADLRFSPDGKRLALSEANTNILVYDWSRDVLARLTFTPSNRFPVWAADGKHIVYASRGTSLQWIRADGGGDVVKLLESKYQLTPYSFSPDGKRLAFAQSSSDTAKDIWTLPLDTSDPEHPKPGAPELFLRTPFDEQEPAFSPDGGWIAYTSSESGRYEIYVRPFRADGPPTSGKWLVSAMGGRLPVWSRDGRELFYETLDNHIAVIAVAAKGESFSAEKPRLWSDTQLLDIPPAWNLALAPDGKRFAVIPRPELTGEQKGSLQITFLLNFFDEVRRRIPQAK